MLPTVTMGPGGVRAVWPLVCLAMAIAGAAAMNELLASDWSWKSVPFTPLIVPILGMTFGGAPPGLPTKSAEGSVV